MNGINDVNGPNGQQHYKPLEAQSIAQRQQEVWNVCRALKDRNELYGVLTRNSAIAMWGVPDPSMDSARTADGVPAVHVVVQTARNRRKGIPGVVAHVWKGLSEEHICHTQDGIDVLAPEPTWASMAETLSVDMLVELAESQMRHGRTTKEKLAVFLEGNSFRGRRKCQLALLLVESGSDSPKETELRLCLLSYGLSGFAVGYVVSGISFENGAAVTLDLADPELKIGIEYDGDHHRTDKMQWRRDVWKRRQLESMGWTIVAVTQLDLSDEPHRAALAMNVAMIRARKSGHPVALHTPVSW